jgi:signal transduction histidine kinase/CheY-like chemotaxis protein
MRAWLAMVIALAALPLAAVLLVQSAWSGGASAVAGALLTIGASLALAVLLAGMAQRRLAAQALDQGRAAEGGGGTRDEFITLLGHELRNPLGAISAAVDVLESTDTDGETAAEARSIISRQTRTLSHMVNDLLEVSRLFNGKTQLAMQPVDLTCLVQRVQHALVLSGAAAGRQLTTRLDAAWTEGDPGRLEQVVSNLAGNALKYSPAGGEVVLSVRRDAGNALIEVRDRGAGIARDLLPHIFEPFVQGDRPADRRAGGFGIGLTLVRRLVELHGGTVEVESSAQGSCFRVSLSAIDPVPGLDRPRPSAQRRFKMLLVEGNQDVLGALRAELELDGHAVSTARDGHDGLRQLLLHKPQVSIIDTAVPGLSGCELAREARAAGYAGRMVALSGTGTDREIAEAMRAGFDTCLVKPVTPEQVRACLNG